MKKDTLIKIFGFWLPGIATLSFGVWNYWLISQGLLPEMVAVHWGISGRADGFAPPELQLLMNLSIALALWLIMLLAISSKKVPIFMRLVFSVGFSIFLLWLLGFLANLTALQIGLSDPQDAPLPIFWLVAGILPLFAMLIVLLSMPKVTISNQLVVSALGIPLLKLERSEIAEVNLATLKAREFGGLGLRIGRKGVAIIPSSGAGVEIVTLRGERIYLRHSNPGLLVQLLGRG